MLNVNLIAEPEIVLMSTLHIKLGLMKQSLKTLDEKSKAFEFLRGFFQSCQKPK